MKRRTYMVRLTYLDAEGFRGVARFDRRARTPQEAIRAAARAMRSKNPSARIEGASAFPYVVIR